MSWRETYKEHLTPTGQLKRTSSVELKTEVFIARAVQLHGYKYDYSKVKYGKNNMEKVEIICPEHGSFFQSPNTHLAGKGCIICAGKQKKTADDFISQARSAHGDKFDYSKVVYKNTDTKVEIICPEHGSFFQIPKDHIRGVGCCACKNSNQKTVYLIEYLCAGTRLGTKVGITSVFDRRFAELKRASPYDMEFVQCWIVEDPRAIESKVLERFTRVDNLGGSFDGSTEILEEPTEQIAQFIEELIYASI